MREDRPSRTATLIAAATVFLGRDPHLSGLVPAGAAAACAQFLESVSPAAAAAVDLISRPGWRWIPRLVERATVPGLPLHFIVRKRFIEDAVRESIADGARQVVVVGAGFDTLVLRLGREHPGVRFVEIDHPATQDRKRAAAGSGSPYLRFIAADLSRRRLADVLRAESTGLVESSTVFVIEGLLMYLPWDAVHQVFAALAPARPVRTRVVFTLMEPAPDGRLRFHNATLFERWLLSLWGEPFTSALSRAEIAPFLARHGYRLMEVADSETLRARYLAPAGLGRLVLARGELVCVAQRDIAAP